MSLVALKDYVRWLFTALALLLGLFAMGMNAVWAVQARRARQGGRRGPSLVPVAAPILGLTAAILAPTWWMAVAVPAFCLLDIGTMTMLRALWHPAHR